MTAAPERDPRLGAGGLALAAGAFIAAIFGALVLSSIALAATGAKPGETPFAVATASSVGLWFGFLGIPVLAARWRGGASAYLGLRARLVDLPVGIAAGVASTVATGVVSALLLDGGQTRELEEKASDVIERAQHPGAVALLVLVVCVLTPLAEEVYFRGLVFRSLARIVPPAVALVPAALVFGVVHFSGGSAEVVAIQLGLLALFGAVLCGLTWATGRIGSAVVAHATFNLITVASELAQR